ncbi:hypothetical protein [Phyllobacterium zundukense]|uniref:hypothetical protein n=1 Tax=Phyllobacterium zundukense TaxID=1867719 RepID=UPI0029057B68|nr:hypothetical protein [Phyllobacterium zundukense]
MKDHIRFDDAEFHNRETRVIGSRNAVQSDFATVMAANRSGKISTDALCSVILPQSAFAAAPARTRSDPAPMTASRR